MGLSNRSATPKIFVQFNARDGGLYTTEKSESGAKTKTRHDAISGTVTGVYVEEDEYEGKKNFKLNVAMVDGPARYQVTFNADARPALELMGRLNNADIGHPVKINPYVIEAGSAMADGTTREKDFVGVSLRQGSDFGQKIEPFYNEELGNKQPKPIKLLDDNGNVVKVKGEEQLDKEATLAAHQALMVSLIDRIQSNIAVARQGQGQGEAQASDEVDADAAMAAMRDRRG